MATTLDSHPKAIPWVLGKPFQVVTDPQAQCEAKMGPCCGTMAYFFGRKGGENLVLYSMSQTLPI